MSSGVPIVAGVGVSVAADLSAFDEGMLRVKRDSAQTATEFGSNMGKAEKSAERFAGSLDKVSAAHEKAARASGTDASASDRATEARNRAMSATDRLRAAHERAAMAIADQQRMLGALTAANDNASGSIARTIAAASRFEPALARIGLGAVGAAAGLGLIVAGAAAVAGTVAGTVAAGDAWTRYGNQLQAAGVASTQVAATQTDLARLAIDTRASLDSTVGLYARMTRATGELGATQAQVRRVTEILSKDLANSGITSAEAAGGLLQFSQALQAGTLNGDELRSVLENMPGVAKAIAAEFRVTVGELRDLGAEGKLTSDRVFRAVLNAGRDVDAAFAKTTPTISQGVEIAKTGLIALGAEIDRSTGLSKLLAAGLETLGRGASDAADKVDRLRLAGEALRVKNLQDRLRDLEGSELDFAQSLSVPGRANPELDRVKAETQQVRDQLVQAMGDIDGRIQAMVGLPERALRPMSDELRGVFDAAEQAARGLFSTAGAADAAGNAMASAAVKARGFAEALNAIQAANPNIAPTLALVGKIEGVNKELAAGIQGVKRDFEANAISEAEATARTTRLTEDARKAITALRSEAEKPFRSYAREAEIGAMGDLEQKLARAGDRYTELRQKAVDHYDTLAQRAATPEARGEVERQKAAELARLDKAYQQVGATERKNAAEKAARSSGGSGTDAFDTALQRSKDQIEEYRLQAEVAGKATEEVYRLTEANRLRRAAASAGRADEAGVKAAIDETSAALARQRAETDRVLEAQRRLQEGQRELANQFTSFIDDLLTGSGRLTSALSSIGRSFVGNGLKAFISGEGPLAGLLGTAPTQKGDLGGLLGGQLPFGQIRDAVREGTTLGTKPLGESFELLRGTPFAEFTGRQVLGAAGGALAIAGAYGTGAGASNRTGACCAGGLSGHSNDDVRAAEAA
jgi:tape measure domain-containing protein